MRKVVNGFILGVLITLLFMGTAFGEVVQQSINVVFNSVNFTVNGNTVQANNILYQGTTYVPLREVAEMLGKDVGWDQFTRTASINDKNNQSTVENMSIDFNKMFGFLSEGSAVVISEDGSWMTVDSNPDNSSSNSPIADILTLEVVRSINDKLGFSGALTEKIGSTRALDGTQYEENEQVKVTWKYHPDNGLLVIYEVKN